jgi:hypothetical protein
MGRYIDSGREFERIDYARQWLVSAERNLPANVFNDDFDIYRFACFDMLFTDRGPHWRQILTFARMLDAGPLSLVMLDPSPASYLSWSGKYGVVVIDPQDAADDMLGVLSLSPETNTLDGIGANAIGVVANRFALFSESASHWCLWADRGHELAVMGTKNCPAWQAIEKTWDDVWFETEHVLDDLLDHRRVPETFRWEFLANYASD